MQPTGFKTSQEMIEHDVIQSDAAGMLHIFVLGYW